MKAASSTSNKVKGLTLANREQYLNKLRDLLYENYETAREDDENYFDKKDMEDCAIDLEYNIFSVNTNMTMYRNSIVKLVRFNTIANNFFNNNAQILLDI